MTDQIPIDTVELLRLRAGDVLLVRVGMTAEELGDQPPWIPGDTELEWVRELFEKTLPGVKTIITHIGVKAQVVREDASEEAS